MPLWHAATIVRVSARKCLGRELDKVFVLLQAGEIHSTFGTYQQWFGFRFIYVHIMFHCWSLGFNYQQLILIFLMIALLFCPPGGVRFHVSSPPSFGPQQAVGIYCQAESLKVRQVACQNMQKVDVPDCSQTESQNAGQLECHMSHRMPERMHKWQTDIPDRISEYMPDRTPENMPERTTEDMR